MKVISINVSVFLVLWLVLEAANFLINWNFSFEKTCGYSWIKYNYCPNLDFDVTTDIRDGGATVNIITNNIGQRVGGPVNQAVNEYQLVIVGDSFIQAEKLAIEDTFYSQLTDKYTVSAIGYSSWNVIQYEKAIKKLDARGAHHMVFIMTNDVLPRYYRSTLNDEQTQTAKPFSADRSFSMRETVSRSVTHRLYSYISGNTKLFLKAKLENWKLPHQFQQNLFSRGNIENCTPLEELSNTRYGMERLGFDYLVYSKPERCWPAEYMTAAEKVLDGLESLREFVEVELGGRLTIFSVPAGWAFPNQNTVGRLDHYFYRFPEGMSVTQKPLDDYFLENLKNVDYVPLEPIFADELAKCAQGCKDKLYLPVDGHWTAWTHAFLNLVIEDHLQPKELPADTSSVSVNHLRQKEQ